MGQPYFPAIKNKWKKPQLFNTISEPIDGSIPSGYAGLYFDSSDNKLKLKKFDNTIVSVESAVSQSGTVIVSHSETIGDYTTPSSPVTTSNTITHSGETPSQSGSSIVDLNDLIDGDTETLTDSIPNSLSATYWIKLDRGSVKNGRYRVRVKKTGTTTQTLKIETSDDDSIWTQRLGSQGLTTSLVNYDMPSIISFRYIRVSVTASNNAGGSIEYTELWDLTQTSSALTDNDTSTHWQSVAEINPAFYVDMGSTKNILAIALYVDSNITETSIKIRISSDTTFSDAETVRTILVSNLTTGAWNYIRFNLKNSRYIQVYGSSGSSVILSISEIKYLTKTDSQILVDLGTLYISPTDTSIDLSGV